METADVPAVTALERDHVDACLEKLDGIPDLDRDVEGIVSRIQALEKRFKRAMEETLEEHGLSYGEWKVLGSLRNAGTGSTRTPGELSSELELSSGAMTNRLDRLEKAGLVKRLSDPDDRRGVLIELTDEGEKKWVATAEVQASYENLIGAALNKREKEQLNSLLRRLMLEFERNEAGDSKKP